MSEKLELLVISKRSAGFQLIRQLKFTVVLSLRVTMCDWLSCSLAIFSRLFFAFVTGGKQKIRDFHFL